MALLSNETDVSVLVDGLDHVEGIAWGLDGYCYAGGEAGQIYRIDVENQEVVQIADTGGFILGLALDARHNIYACDTGNKAVMKIAPDGSVTKYTTGAPGEPFNNPNYPAFNANGNLYVCDSGDWKSDNGKIYRVMPGGRDRGLDSLAVRISQRPLHGSRRLQPVRGDEPESPLAFPRSQYRRMALPDLCELSLRFLAQCQTVWLLTPMETCMLPATVLIASIDTRLPGSSRCSPMTLRVRSLRHRQISRSVARSGTFYLSANLGRWHITRYETGARGLPLQYPDLG